MTREEAIDIVRKNYPHVGVSGSQFETALQNLIPELKESEDEKIRKDLITFICQFAPKHLKVKYVAYLEKQKEQKPESCDCSRDEESYTNGIHHVLMNLEAYGLIKQKPAEWSEEDEWMLNCIIATLCEESHGGRETNNKMVTWLENRLKSLRPVSKESLQPHWKPSKEQINYLGAAVIEAQRRHNESVNGFPRYYALKELYEQLLKL